jgi:Arc/MetJ-type ribon-helix-helix transcriptional regulator
MNKPVQSAPVVVTLSPDDAADLVARVERGEFASLDEALAAELAELNYRRASEIMGGSEKLERFLDELEAESIDTKDYVDAEDFFADLRASLGQRLDAPRG